MPTKVAIIDYGIGNLLSLSNAIEKVGHTPIFVDNPNYLFDFDKAILPGVGAFNACYKSLERKNFISEIKKFASSDKKLMGICVGMQLLFSYGYEGAKTPGFNFISGEVKKISNKSKDPRFKLPHIGWNNICLDGKESTLFRGIEKDEIFYFVHSFSAFCNPDAHSLTVGVSSYCDNEIISYVEKDNIVGCQFHPEKSRSSGLTLLKNFVEW